MGQDVGVFLGVMVWGEPSVAPSEITVWIGQSFAPSQVNGLVGKLVALLEVTVWD